jgi:hypothetical protein
VSRNIIAIPSRGRSQLMKRRQKTFAYVIGCSYEVWLVVRESEAYDYENGDYRIFTVPDHCKITDKRQMFMDHCRDAGIDNVLWLDDDLMFYPRDDRYSSHYAMSGRPKHLIMNEIADQMFSLCSERFPMVGMLFKQGSQNNKKAFHFNKKIMQTWCLNVSTIFLEQLYMTDAPNGVLEDFYLMNKLRSLGFLLPTIGSFCMSDGGRIPGGCQEYRDVKLHNDAVQRFNCMFPECTEVKIVKANTYWAHDRLDLKIDTNYYLPKKLPTKVELLTYMKSNGYDGNLLMEPVENE